MATFRKRFDFVENWLHETSGNLLVVGWVIAMSAVVLGFTTAGCYLFHGRTDWIMTMDWLSTGLAHTSWWFAKIGIPLMALRFCLLFGGKGYRALFGGSEA